MASPIELLELGETEAISSLMRWVKENPKDALGFECLGIAQMRASKFNVADDSLERAIALSPKPLRSLMLNRTIVALQHKNTSFSVAKKVATWIKNHNVPADDELLNIYGSLLYVAASATKQNNAFGDLVLLYEYKNSELENARNQGRFHNAQRRWGPVWLSENEYSRRKRDFDSGVSDYQQSLNWVADAQRDLKNAEAEAAQERRRAALRGKIATGGQNRSWVRDAESRVREAKENAQRARSRIPYPKWPTTYSPVLPVLEGEAPTQMAELPSPDETFAEPEEERVTEAAPPRQEPGNPEPPTERQQQEPRPGSTFRASVGMAYAEIVAKLGLPTSRKQLDATHFNCVWQTTEKVAGSIFDFDGEAGEIRKKVTVDFENEAAIRVQESLL